VDGTPFCGVLHSAAAGTVQKMIWSSETIFNKQKIMKTAKGSSKTYEQMKSRKIKIYAKLLNSNFKNNIDVS
jgi:hypothetical protein